MAATCIITIIIIIIIIIIINKLIYLFIATRVQQTKPGCVNITDIQRIIF